MPKTTKIVASETGLSSDWIATGAGDHVIQFRWAGTPGVADLVMRSNGAAFADVIGCDGKVAVTTNTAVVVAGGSDYSVEVDTATSALTVTAIRSTP